MKRMMRRPSPAMALAVIALIVALGGTAAAGGGFLTKKKFANQAVRGPIVYSSSTTAIPPTGAGQGTTVTATCPAGFVPVGGGIRTLNDVTGDVNDSHPIAGGWAGTVNNISATTPFNAIVTAICAQSKFTSGTLQTGS